ncbi:MAG: sel1 repeat family protein [Helicobacteraceae bacterium]|jgi:TPR repeat protein|nr:sel1 repeat family protein [Helicobacteraceae bacterium]
MIRLITVLVLLSTFAFSITQTRKECENKNGKSCYELGESYSSGTSGLKKDRQKAVELYKQACDYKYGKACDLLGYSTEDNNLSLSLEYYDKGCECGYHISCTRAANIYVKDIVGNENGRTDINASKALEYRIKACDLNAGNCSAVAYLYETGYEGVPKDMSKAIEYYKKDCDSKYQSAFDSCQRVGYAYEIGEGIPKDLKIASEYYAKACKNDPLGAICYRAKATRIMAETKEDSVIKAFEKACDVNKEAIACSSIARMYELGWNAYDSEDHFYDYRAVQIDLEFPKAEVAPKDLDKALKYYTKACKYGKDRLDCFSAKELLKQKKAQETNASIK